MNKGDRSIEIGKQILLLTSIKFQAFNRNCSTNIMCISLYYGNEWLIIKTGSTFLLWIVVTNDSYVLRNVCRVESQFECRLTKNIAAAAAKEKGALSLFA